jgi:glycine cleavage system H protein
MSDLYEFTADKFVFKVKKGLQYSREEVWVRPEASGYARVGITDFAQRRGGDIIFADIQPIGTDVVSGGLLGSYETVKVVQDILSPVGGRIIEVNSIIDSRPEVINGDPFGAGWIAVIKPESGFSGLLSADEYFKMMKSKVAEELKKIKRQ